MFKVLNKYALHLAFLQAWTATLGSLYFSEIKQLPPCQLCWYQRIFMYPIAILLGVAIMRRDKNVAYYVLPLSVFGALIAAYHYLLRMTSIFDTIPVSCGAFGSCSEIQAVYLGFVTIPFLSLSAFVVISVAMIILIKAKQK